MALFLVAASDGGPHSPFRTTEDRSIANFILGEEVKWTPEMGPGA